MLLVGCEAPATPVPVGSSNGDGNPSIARAESGQTLPQAQATDAPAIRYGIAANTINYVQNIAELEASATVIPYTQSDDLSTFDIVATFGVVEGWQQAPTPQTVTLHLNADLAPLDNPDILNIVLQSVDSTGLVSLVDIAGLQTTEITGLPTIEAKNRLANLGYPDGVQLTIAHEPSPVLDALAAEMQSRNVFVRFVEMGSVDEARLHGTLQHTLSPDASSLSLLRIPVSYLADDSLTTLFGDSGFPIATR